MGWSVSGQYPGLDCLAPSPRDSSRTIRDFPTPDCPESTTDSTPPSTQPPPARRGVNLEPAEQISDGRVMLVAHQGRLNNPEAGHPTTVGAHCSIEVCQGPRDKSPVWAIHVTGATR